MMNGIKAGLELQKISISMGKVYKTLSTLSGKIQDNLDVYDNKEDFYVLAYTCRVAILDRIQANDWIPNANPDKDSNKYVYLPQGNYCDGVEFNDWKIERVGFI